MAVYLLVVYTVSRPFGAAAQAGFGIGMRVMQALFMPVVALSFGVAPIAGQNFGARNGARVRETFRTAAAITAGVMVVIAALWTVIDWIRSAWPLGGFGWGSLGVSQVDNRFTVRLASVAGVWGTVRITKSASGSSASSEAGSAPLMGRPAYPLSDARQR